MSKLNEDFKYLVDNIMSIPDDPYKWEHENIEIKVNKLRTLCEEYAERVKEDERGARG